MKIGTDYRKNGITWIIEALENLGEKVEIDDLPDFLDDKAK